MISIGMLVSRDDELKEIVSYAAECRTVAITSTRYFLAEMRNPHKCVVLPSFFPILPFLHRFCRISRESAASIAAFLFPRIRFPARHIVLPVVEARRRVPLHNVLDVLERVDASGPDDIFPSRLLSEINCHSIFIVVYLSRQLSPRPLSLDNRLINQAFFVAAV